MKRKRKGKREKAGAIEEEGSAKEKCQGQHRVSLFQWEGAAFSVRVSGRVERHELAFVKVCEFLHVVIFENLSLRSSVMTLERVAKVNRKHLPGYVTERPS
jgi:hypothetical protein